MDELIVAYIESKKLTPEMTDTVFKAFRVMEAFEVQDIYTNLIDWLVMEQNETPETIYDGFFDLIHRKLNVIVDKHRISLDPDILMRDKVDLLDALYRFMYLENYDTIYACLNSTEPDDVQFCKVIALLTDNNETEWMSKIVYISESSVDLMRKFVKSKVSDKEDDIDLDTIDKIHANLSMFSKCFGSENLANQLTIAGVAIGASFAAYYQIIHDVFDDLPPADLAMNLLGVFMLTPEGSGDLLKLFRDNIELVTTDLKKIGETEIAYQKLIDQLKIITGVQNAANRLP